MGRNGRCSWDDGQVLSLVAQALDDGDAGCDESPTSSAQDHKPTELCLADVVDAGRAAFVWLDVIVSLRHVPRHDGLLREPRRVMSLAPTALSP
ncbi:hypothetical protein LY71_1287 [Geodermatophilus tzadiensis]|uniref:Uncharacterized protein n=1 Tax=Geodermatophilus tzadiensis TaxID=1137988 RepID=A0A2T0SQ69_9ACTN|nr:hypothetical protein [Geodermatophilus tzadiensis]PRY35567.1 hypothetical protein LY71_1287 [Geodermatophilus tzadiensis]